LCGKKRNIILWECFFGRVQFALKLSAVVDIMAIIPFWIAFVAGLGYVSLDISFASAIRIFRIFKLFKAEKYFKAIKILSLVIKNNREVLMMTIMLGVITFTLTATGLWIAEKDNPANPEFYSIPSSLYMSMLMLCGLNIPEHMTSLGKVVVGVTGIFSIAVFAIPTGIIAWGFEPVASELIKIRSDKREMKRMRRMGLVVNTSTDDPIEEVDITEIYHITKDRKRGLSRRESMRESIREKELDGYEFLKSKVHQCPHCNKEFFCEFAEVPVTEE